MTLRFRSAESSLPVSLISRLRELTGLSIGDLRSRAAGGAPLFEITAFENDWDEVRTNLAALARDMSAGVLPLVVSEVDDDADDDEGEMPVTGTELGNLIEHYREIELQDQRNEDLRMGVITSPDEFEPHDDDWTQP